MHAMLLEKELTISYVDEQLPVRRRRRALWMSGTY